MTQIPIARGSHAVRFFESDEHAFRTIADYFTEDARVDDHCIMVARPGTLAGVRRALASGTDRGSGKAHLVEGIRFVDAESSLAEFVRGNRLDREHAEEFFVRLLSRLPAGGESARIRLYGELVDVLCERGQYAVAHQIEDMAGLLFAFEPRLSILCGYHIRHFADEPGAAMLRAICGKHTDIGPLPESPDPRRNYENGDKVAPPGVATAARASLPIVYLVDDDPSMRRSLARLISVSNYRVRTFDSAEAFLKEADLLSEGCLVVDIQLGGMTGLDLLAALAVWRSQLPVIVMSGFHDERFESEAMRLGARAFLQKPFEPQILLDLVARILHRA